MISQTLGTAKATWRCKPQPIENPMRNALFLASTVAVLAVTSTGPAAAASDKYCLQGRIWGYPGNCTFATYAQCQATASGTNAYCDINPRWAFAQQGRRYRGY
jgi:hypothetical protein